MTENLERAIEKMERSLTLKRLDYEELVIAKCVIERMIEGLRWQIDSHEELLQVLESERRRL